MDAQSCALGEGFLGQSGRPPVLSQLFSETGYRLLRHMGWLCSLAWLLAERIRCPEPSPFASLVKQVDKRAGTAPARSSMSKTSRSAKWRES